MNEKAREKAKEKLYTAFVYARETGGPSEVMRYIQDAISALEIEDPNTLREAFALAIEQLNNPLAKIDSRVTDNIKAARRALSPWWHFW